MLFEDLLESFDVAPGADYSVSKAFLDSQLRMDVVLKISQSSVRRDYVEKSEDYWHAGSKEYVIADRFREIVQVQRRAEGATQWVVSVLRRGEVYTTALLPGLAIPIDAIFDAARI